MQTDAHILLVDDDTEYVPLIIIALQEANVFNPVRVLTDGIEAIHYLCGEGPYGDRNFYPLPDLVLMDLRMPKLGGFQLLSWIRAQPELYGVQVAILTGSEMPGEQRRALEAGADFFYYKPFEFSKLVALIKEIAACSDRVDGLRKAA